jgi:opacity protein-like surface antigen
MLPYVGRKCAFTGLSLSIILASLFSESAQSAEPADASKLAGVSATTRNISLGLQVSNVAVNSQGFYAGAIHVSPSYGAVAEFALARRSALAMVSEVAGSDYLNFEAQYRFYPLSLATRSRVVHPLAAVECEDRLRPYGLVGLSRGKLRLQTQDEIGATEINASFYGPVFGVGVNIDATTNFVMNTVVSYSQLMATSDSVVAFHGSRLVITVGGAWLL